MTEAAHAPVPEAAAKDFPYETVAQDGALKNAKSTWCRRCGSHIMAPMTATLVNRPLETLSDNVIFTKVGNHENGLICWHLKDMYDFMNIGFTRKTCADDDKRPLRYLTCADCEKDVLGFQYLDEPDNFYILAERVLYQKPEM